MLTLCPLLSFAGHSRTSMLISCTEFSKDLNKNCFVRLLIRNKTSQYYHAKIIFFLPTPLSSTSFFCLMLIPFIARIILLFCLRAENYKKYMVELLLKLWKFCFGTCTVNQQDDVVRYNWEEKYKTIWYWS